MTRDFSIDRFTGCSGGDRTYDEYAVDEYDDEDNDDWVSSFSSTTFTFSFSISSPVSLSLYPGMRSQ
eukprot:CAMPEP_0170930660 /NCGR_PEP_ID=MMETSP0735-20130129/15649_1 /TAXON_ID=186038 /ORGANISM="Fragilariopsis kerguelensis, Strain L26-C5" /LENGTH=66 /DNA_ID=CAMNT_0011332249 /DNA_START=20 /DNA_END=217 /DNA_ORIENTATION=-